jgi:hypothetical protein
LAACADVLHACEFVGTAKESTRNYSSLGRDIIKL